MADLHSQVLDLQHRVGLLEAERGVLRTLYQLAQAIDYGEHDLWLDCFTDDGVFQMAEVSASGRVVKARKQGREELRGTITGHTSAPAYFHKHVTTVPLVTLDAPGEATAVSYFSRFDAGEAGPFIWSLGRYVDRLVEGADGRWRVSERQLEVDSRAKPVRPSDIGAQS